MGLFYSKDGQGQIKLYDGRKVEMQCAPLAPDPDFGYQHLQCLYGIGFAKCASCGTQMEHHNLYERTALGPNSLSPDYVFGCSVCRVWMATLEGAYYRNGPIFGGLISTALDPSHGFVPPKLHIEKDFYAFTLNSLFGMFPLGLYSFHNYVYSQSSRYGNLVPNFLYTSGVFTRRQPMRSDFYGIGALGRDYWFVASRMTQMMKASSVPSLRAIGSHAFPEGFIEKYKFTTARLQSFLTEIEKARTSITLINERSAELREFARQFGILPPEVSASFKLSLNECLKPFGDPEKILQRKHYKLRRA